MQALGEVGFLGAFAFAGGVALRLAEDFEEVRPHRRVGQLQSPRAGGQAGVVLRSRRHLMERVVQHLGGQPLGIIPREVLLVLQVVIVGQRTELVGFGPADRADQLFHIEAAVDEVLRQRVEQFGIGRRVGFPHVVFRFDDAPAEEVLPIAVDQSLGEERVSFGSAIQSAR